MPKYFGFARKSAWKSGKRYPNLEILYEKLKTLHAIYVITYGFKLYHLRHPILVPFVSAGWVSANSVLMCSNHELRKLGNLTKDECELVKRWAAEWVMASGFIPGKILNAPRYVSLYQQGIFGRIHGHKP